MATVCLPQAERTEVGSMNRFEKFFGIRNEARLRFLDGEFQVISHGDFVRCAVTGDSIPLDHLRYWNVERQEAYASAQVSLERQIGIMRQQRATRRG